MEIKVETILTVSVSLILSTYGTTTSPQDDQTSKGEIYDTARLQRFNLTVIKRLSIVNITFRLF